MINKYIASDELTQQFFNLNEDIISSCEEEARRIVKLQIPEVSLSSQENKDLIIRPIASVIALYEIMLQNLFSFSSIHTLKNSVTLPEYVKANMLKSMARSGGIEVFGEDSETIYNQIVFFLKNNDSGSIFGLNNIIFSSVPTLSRLFFADINQVEMTRNKISPIRFEATEQMHFTATALNPATLLDGGYSRRDMRRYMDSQVSKKISLSGMLDVYFDAGTTHSTVAIEKSPGGRYNLPAGYYIDIASEKEIVIIGCDERKNGIVKTSPSVFIEGGGDTEHLSFTKYTDIDIEDTKVADNIATSDVLFKGFYPILASIKIRSKHLFSSSEREDISNTIKEYIYLKKGRIESLSIYELQETISALGYPVVVASTFDAELYFQLNIKSPLQITFPITESDLLVPLEYKNLNITGNIVTIKVREVIFETE